MNGPLRFALLGAALLLGACDDPSGSGPGAPAQMEIVSGDLPASVVVGTEVPNALVVRVLDDDGDPVPGRIVNFVVTAGGGRVFAGTAQTNAQGEARERWTLGTVAGDTQRVEARAVDSGTGQPLVFAVFRAVAAPGAPHAVATVGAAVRAGGAGAALADSLAARVTDQYGNGVPGATVVWAVSAGGGAVSPAQSTTDAQGVARTQWSLGARVDGTQTAEASISPAVRASFTATAGLPMGSVLQKVSGDGQAGQVGGQLSTALAVRLVLPDGRPVQGASVTWGVNPGAGTITPPVSITDVDGRAQATWTLGTASGGQVATAASGTVSALFTASGAPGAPAGLALVGGGGQTGAAGGALAEQLAVRVTDAHGNPVGGAQVLWGVLAGGGNVTAQSTADADGTARVTWTLGMRVDAQQRAEATIAGLRVEITAMPGIPSTAELALVSGGGQSATVGTALASPLVVMLRLADGRGIIGAPVTFSPTPGSGGITPATSVTDANGRVSATWTVGQQAGAASATAGAPGVASLALGATATSGAAASIAVVSGSGQSGSVGVALGAPLVVKVTDSFGNPVSGATVTWSASKTSSFAPGQSATDAQGVAQSTWTPQQNGAQTATASLAGGTGASFSAEVAWSPASVTVTPASGTVLVGDSLVLSASATGANGGTLSGAQFQWSTVSVNNSLTVTAGGVLRASAYYAGGGKVIATLEGKADTAEITIRRPRFESVVKGGACALDRFGHVVCPGLMPELPLGLAMPRSARGTTAEVCAINFNGTRACWTPARGYEVVSNPRNLVTLDVNCGLNAAGQAYCSGTNYRGEVGDGTIRNRNPGGYTNLAAVVGGHTFTEVTGGPGVFNCALNTSGAAYCWGYDDMGQLGTEATTELCSVSLTFAGPCSPIPLAVQGGHTFTQLAAGDNHACGLKSGGAIYCWGLNTSGQLGTGSATGPDLCSNQVSTPDTPCATTPVQVQAGGVQFQKVVASGATTCALATDGRAFCWGRNDNGNFGNGGTANSSAPVLVAGGHTFKDIGISGSVSALTTDGRLFRWGNGVTTPTQVAGQV